VGFKWLMLTSARELADDQDLEEFAGAVTAHHVTIAKRRIQTLDYVV
jgi:hypothetical protein